MRIQWFHLKDKAIVLRKRGLSIRDIERSLKIPRSTLSPWLSDVTLTVGQRNELHKNWKEGLRKAREGAMIWHREQKQNRLMQARIEATDTLEKINVEDRRVLEVALAMLYLGEGSKVNTETALGSSNPMILKFFVKLLKKIYSVETKKIRCELGLRADQDVDSLKRYWSRTLGLPLSCIRRINIDKRTRGSKTYQYYKGVCHIRCGRTDIQRKLIFLSDLFCSKVIGEENKKGLGHVAQMVRARR